jgi:hypothetical protein
MFGLLYNCPIFFILESKMIEKHGGYKFTVPEVVPTNFNFGGNAPGMN